MPEVVLPGLELRAGGHARPDVGWLLPAVRTEDSAPVLVTLVAPGLSSQPAYQRRFGRRMRELESLEHPGAPELLGWGESQGSLYAAVGRPPGRTLAALLRAGAPAERLLDALEEVAGLLDALHSKGIALGDLAPDRIWIDERGASRCTAMGLADLGAAVHPHEPVPAGVLAYAAPEQLRGSRPGPRSDAYSWAAILHEILTGRPLHGGDREAPVSRTQALESRAGHDSPTLRAPEGPGAYALARSLALEPASRRSGAVALLDAVRGRDLAADDASVAAAKSGDMGPAVYLPGAGGTVRRQSPPTQPGEPSRAVAVRSAPTRSRPPRSNRLRFLITAVLAMTLSAVAGTQLAAGMGDSTAEPAPPREPGRASSRALVLSHPPSWRSVDGTPAFAGLALDDPIAISPQFEPRTLLVAGMAPQTVPGLLPAALSDDIADVTPAEPVMLGRHEAVHHRRLVVAGESRQVSTWSVPTDRGVVLIACLAPVPAATAMSTCQSIASSLELREATARPVGPDRAYAVALDRQMGRLDADRATGLRRLASARTVTGQAERASRLASAYDTAADGLEDLTPGPGLARLHPRLVGTLRATGDAYRGLSAAATRRDRPGYNEARRLVVGRERNVAQALAAFERLGYRSAN